MVVPRRAFGGNTLTARSARTLKDEQANAYEELGKHARLADLVAIARSVAQSMVLRRTTAWPGSGVRGQASEAKLKTGDASTPFGNAIAVLERGPETDGERALVAALWAHAIAEAPPKGREAEDRLAADVAWLATNTPFDVTRLIDRALGDAAADVWDALAARVRKIDAHQIPASRGEGLVACAALAYSTAAAAAKHASAMSKELKDPFLKRALAGAGSLTLDARIEGELAAAPRGPVATAALALSGILLVMNGARLLGRLALAYRRPAEVTLSADSIRIQSRTELLGRTLRDRQVVIGRQGLVRAAREVRYPGTAFYAGLLSLAVGSYFGVAMLVDGTRAASPSLLLTGLAVVAAGIALDFAFTSLAPGARGRCRVVFVPRRGPAICLGDVDAERADDALARLVAKADAPR